MLGALREDVVVLVQTAVHDQRALLNSVRLQLVLQPRAQKLDLQRQRVLVVPRAAAFAKLSLAVVVVDVVERGEDFGLVDAVGDFLGQCFAEGCFAGADVAGYDAG